MKTKHHQVPTSRNGSNSPNNIIMLEEELHQDHHRLLGNLTPAEQLELVLELNAKVMREAVVEEISEILNRDPHRLYKPSAFKNKKDLTEEITHVGELYKVYLAMVEKLDNQDD